MATTLKGGDVYTAITIRDTKMPYKAETRLVGQFYHVGQWGKRGFTCSVQFFQDWRDGKIKEMSIDESFYEREDPASGEKVIVDSATIGGYVTWDRATNILNYASEYQYAEARAEMKVQHAKIAVIAELGLKIADLKMLEELAMTEKDMGKLVAGA